MYHMHANKFHIIFPRKYILLYAFHTFVYHMYYMHTNKFYIIFPRKYILLYAFHTFVYHMYHMHANTFRIICTWKYILFYAFHTFVYHMYHMHANTFRIICTWKYILFYACQTFVYHMHAIVHFCVSIPQMFVFIWRTISTHFSWDWALMFSELYKLWCFVLQLSKLTINCKDITISSWPERENWPHRWHAKVPLAICCLTHFILRHVCISALV